MDQEMLIKYQADLRDRSVLQVHLKHLREDLSARALVLTPLGEAFKALGPNDQAREIAVKKIYAADDVYQKITSSIRKFEVDLSEMEADITSFEAARRDWEWGITARLAEVLATKSANPGREAGQQAAIDQARSQGAESAGPEWWGGEEVPF